MFDEMTRDHEKRPAGTHGAGAGAAAAWRSSATATGWPESESDGRANAYEHFLLEGADWDLYDRICRAVDFPRTVSRGLLGHFAGPTSLGWEAFDLWLGREAMERVFGRYLVDAISDVIADSPRRTDVAPELRDVARLLVGPSAAEFFWIDPDPQPDSLARRGLAPYGVLIEDPGGDEEHYIEGCERLGMPERIPEGLIVHVAGPCKDGFRVFDCFRSEDDYRDWYQVVTESIDAIGAAHGRQTKARIREIPLKHVIVNPSLSGGGYLDARNAAGGPSPERPHA